MGNPVDAGRRIARLIGAADNAPGVIRAYHGSPHSFSRFDASKIGTGEGAQAYGHGLYFAGREGVAKTYRDISPAVPSGPSARALQELTEALVPLELEGASIRDAMEQAAEARGELSDGWGNIRSIPPDVLQELGPRLQAVNDEINRLRMRQEQIRNNSRGHMYEVEIGYPEEALLDWDAPMSRQPSRVRDSLERIFAGRVPGDVAGFLASDINPGRDAYDSVGALLTGSGRKVAAPVASSALGAAGIPGIRYLDQGSRAAGEGSRNYVMFPGTEDRIRILRQYGLLPPLAGGLALQEDE